MRAQSRGYSLYIGTAIHFNACIQQHSTSVSITRQHEISIGKATGVNMCGVMIMFLWTTLRLYQVVLSVFEKYFLKEFLVFLKHSAP
jgi:hypothetical protein